MRPSPKELRATFRYDSAAGQLWWRERGLGRRFSKPVGSVGGKGYIHVEYKGVAYKLHHVVWAIVKGRWPVRQIDHRNSIEGDNRFENLRQATLSQQAANKGRYSSNTSGYKGVYPVRNKWRVALQVNKKRKNLGYFDTPELGHAAYVAAAKKHFGEFARAA